MIEFKLEIQNDEDNWWGYSNIGTSQEPVHYNVFANSLEELRKLLQEGINGDLEIEKVAFKEVFVECNSLEMAYSHNDTSHI